MEKIIIDTNIILRYFEEKETLLKTYLTDKNINIHIPLQIITETVFVMEKSFSITREDITRAINTLLYEPSIVSEKELISKIMEIYRLNKKLSIIECFFIAYGNKNNLDHKTLDKEILKYLNQTHNS